MTRGTGVRASLACLRCRRRKTKCNLRDVGEPWKPPCVSCHHLGIDCTVVASRRGNSGRLRPKRTERHDRARETDSVARSDLANEEQQEDADLSMNLRNPSDALEILARTGESLEVGRRHQSVAYHEQTTESRVPESLEEGLGSRSPICETSGKTFEDFELVQRGILLPSVVPELLHIFAQSYHQHCPITPSWILNPQSSHKLQRADFFLLTVLLTIASRDQPDHALTHRYCWDHAQRLLLEILLAHPWAHTSRTVEGLLLLAEWLPHIQTGPAMGEPPKSLFGEDRMAWSLVGLAVRQGYLLQLDRASFRGFGDESKQQEERHRLVWTFVYFADRQISVRLGQSFWSRGPSLASPFTAKDYPSLQPVPGVKAVDYASVLHATLELTQILYNAHGVLYSSTERTLELVRQGDYGRYLDDFVKSASTWQRTWTEIDVPTKIKSTLQLMYEYVRLYVNAFSFQAVVTRASSSQSESARENSPQGKGLGDIFSRGIMLSPDGQYILDALSAARNLLALMNGLDPRDVLCFLPSRYYLYGVYAAVFLHKAQSAGTFPSAEERDHVANLIAQFISALEEASSTPSHVGLSYARMLRNLWSSKRERRPRHTTRGRPCKGQTKPALQSSSVGDTAGSQAMPSTQVAQPDVSGPSPNDLIGSPWNAGMFDLQDNSAASQTMEGYLFGSFLPGITEFEQQGGLQELNMGTPGFFDGFGL